MGHKFKHWRGHSSESPRDYAALAQIIHRNREFTPVERLEYGDYGLEAAYSTLASALKEGRRLALYADYDVDGTMSCVSWIWFLRAIGYTNFVHYIPDRFSEGYGVNLLAVQKLVREQGAEVVITMDTGITANEEAAWCRAQGVEFICTDHHKIQPEKMPDSIILNPKLHPSPEYQELCGAGITFVLLRKLASLFPVKPEVWTDICALVGMATICDVVPLNGVNHRLAQTGVRALLASQRPVLRRLLEAAAIDGKMDERDVGFRLGPRINAVGRLDHADKVIEAFVNEDPGSLIAFMSKCNDRRKEIQAGIVSEADAMALDFADEAALCLGGESWHQGVVGIAASKIAEKFWKPVWLFQRGDEICKGSARSIPGFDVTDAMSAAKDLFIKFGGHRAAGGFTFRTRDEALVRARLTEYAAAQRAAQPKLWESVAPFDCELPLSLARLPLMDHLESLRPFGHCFSEPVFKVSGTVMGVDFYRDKKTGEPRHTAVKIGGPGKASHKIMFFGAVYDELKAGRETDFLVTASRNTFMGETSLSLIGTDYC